MNQSIFSDTLCWEVIGRCVTIPNIIFSLEFAVIFVLGGYTIIRTTIIYRSMINREFRGLAFWFLITFISFYISLMIFTSYGSIDALQSSGLIGIVPSLIAIGTSFIAMDKLVRITHRFSLQSVPTFREKYSIILILIISIHAFIAGVFLLMGIREIEFLLATIGISTYGFVVYGFSQLRRKPAPRNLRTSSSWLAYASISIFSSVWIILLGARFNLPNLAIASIISIMFMFIIYSTFKSSTLLLTTHR